MPESLGRYELLRELGRGGMGVVYLALDPQLNRQVAIKVLPPDLAGDAEVRERFRREATRMAQLDCPSILPVYDVGEADGAAYFVMRPMANDLAHELARRGRYALPEALPLLQQIAAALDTAHRQGIIHRDIKPANVLLDEEGQAYLTDFGIARAIESDGHNLTRTGMVVGTPAYLSPEQAGGQPVDQRSDLYSFGILAFHLLTGRPPFEGPSDVAVAVQHLRDAPPDPLSLCPSLGRPAAAALRRMLAKDPAQRFGSAAAFVTALTATETAPPPSVAVAPPVSPNRPVWPLAVVVAGLLFFGGALLLVNARPPQAAAPTESVAAPAPLDTPAEPAAEPAPAEPDAPPEVTPAPALPVSSPSPDREPNYGYDWQRQTVAGGGWFERPVGWREEYELIDSDGYRADRWYWICPSDGELKLGLESSLSEADDEGWEPLHRNLARSYGPRYELLEIGSREQHGYVVDLWWYQLRRKSESDFRTIYKLGYTNQGQGVALWGTVPSSRWQRYGGLIQRAVDSLRGGP